jgi:glycerol-3-phosphate dehydrogenase (NAD(P)+)
MTAPVTALRVGLYGRTERLAAIGALVRHAGHTLLGVAGAAPDVEGIAERPEGALAEDADLVIIDVPPATLRAAVRLLRPGPSARVLIATRALEDARGGRLSEVVTAESACLRVGAVAGPIVPGEVRRRSPCAAVVASRFEEVQHLGTRALHSPLCRTYPSGDLVGVELAGALVEVATVALGAARGLGLGAGLQALVVTRAIAEGGRLAARLGGEAQTFAGLAGAGELVAAMGLADHPGHHRGLALARGERDPELVTLCEALLSGSRDLPITEGVRRVAAGEAKLVDAMQALLEREHRDEFD